VQAPNVLVVPASSPHKTIGDVIAYERANPGKMSFASSGNGSSDHLSAELFWQQTGTRGLHVPYKGGGPAITDLLGGRRMRRSRTSTPSSSIFAPANFVRSRSPARSALPPARCADAWRSGCEERRSVFVAGSAGAHGVPADVKSKMHAALVAALNSADIRQQFTDLGFEIVANTPAQFAAYQAQEYARWKKVIETGKITAE
jgi:tripartite-type tricarboxylate transporter receptor subunit TctC